MNVLMFIAVTFPGFCSYSFKIDHRIGLSLWSWYRNRHCHCDCNCIYKPRISSSHVFGGAKGSNNQ